MCINLFQLNFCQEQNKWKHNIIPIEIRKNDSDRAFDLAFYKNHYSLVKKLNVFSGGHHKNFICRPCLNSNTCENMLKLHKPKCKNIDTTTFKTSSESHIYWKKNFHTNQFHFRLYADFEADNELNNSSKGNKTTNF